VQPAKQSKTGNRKRNSKNGNSGFEPKPLAKPSARPLDSIVADGVSEAVASVGIERHADDPQPPWDQVDKVLFSGYFHPLVMKREEKRDKITEKLFPGGLVLYRNGPGEEWKTEDRHFNKNAIGIAERWIKFAIRDMRGEADDLWKAWDRTLAMMDAKTTPELMIAFHKQEVLQALGQREQLIRQKFDFIFPYGFTPHVQRGLLKEARRKAEEASYVRAKTRDRELLYRKKKSSKGHAPTEPGTALGRNINRLRKECGWSYDDLAKVTDIHKTLIIGHVSHGKGATPQTLVAYTSAFSEKLGRLVEVAELER